MAKAERTPRQQAATEKNLAAGKEFQFKSGQEAAENGRRGGIASGEAKREKGRLRSALEALLEKDYSTTKGDIYTGAELIAVGLFNRAKSGDPRAVKLFAEIVDEYKQSVEVTSDGQAVNIVVQGKGTETALQTILSNVQAGTPPQDQKPATAKKSGQSKAPAGKAAKTAKPGAKKKASAADLISRSKAKK